MFRPGVDAPPSPSPPPGRSWQARGTDTACPPQSRAWTGWSPPPHPGLTQPGPPSAFPETRVNQGTNVSPSPWPSCAAGRGLEARPWTPRFGAETPAPPTLRPASRHSPQSHAQRSTGVVAESRPQPTPHPDHRSVPVPCAPLLTAPHSSPASSPQNRGRLRRGLRGPPASAARPSPRERASCAPQIRARAWSAAPARRAACWAAARAASARPTAPSSRRACKSAARTAPPTATSVSCSLRAAAATRTCASCTRGAAAVRVGGA